MKKIDFHIHTSSAFYEEKLIFSLNKLKEYVKSHELDIIAITNHNHFDLEQFREIESNINCEVFPGIEVDIESSHLLVIVPKEEVENFNFASQLLKSRIKTDKDFISYDEFINIFPNFNKYILIPHYSKKPKMSTVTLDKFRNVITAGEVKSPKNFEVLKKNNKELVPVLFSDIRISDSLLDLPLRNTYIDIDDNSFNVVKGAFFDRQKVFLSKDKKNEEFVILPDGTTASTGLNIILGKRSSGKTSILDKIFNSYGGDNIKYIKQFSLTGNSEKSTFDELLLKAKGDFISDYLKPLKNLTSSVLKIDDSWNSDLEDYLSSLNEFAISKNLEDAYSNSKIYMETPFSFKKNLSFEKLLSALKTLFDDKHIKEKMIKENILVPLIVIANSVLEELKKDYVEYKLKQSCDDIMKPIQTILKQKSSMKSINQIDLFNIYKNRKMIIKYDHLCDFLKNEKIINEVNFGKFKLKITRKQFQQIAEVKSILKTKLALGNCFLNYGKASTFIHSLKNAGIPFDDVHKSILFFKVDAFNENDIVLSGGERAEFNLIHEISDSKEYDILLLDEPEASFDNLFISESVVKVLKDISQNTTVFITTHNNSLGMLINPDKILFTVCSKKCFSVFTGSLGSKEFVTADGKKIMSYNNIMEVMEAGTNAYNIRGKIYENFKN